MGYSKQNNIISSDDPNAIVKLEEKVVALKIEQDEMKKANAYFRKNKTMKGYPGLSYTAAVELDNKIKSSYSWEKQPYPAYLLQNNNANIRRLEGRIKQLTKRNELLSNDSGDENSLPTLKGWEFDGGSVVMNAEINRIQILFDYKPDESIRSILKQNGFKWAPSQKAWQRQINSNGWYALKRIACIQPNIEVDNM